LIAALDPRIKVAVPSCYISSCRCAWQAEFLWIQTAIPSRISPELFFHGIDHAGLLLLLYPDQSWSHPPSSTSFRSKAPANHFMKAQRIFERMGHGDRIAHDGGLPRASILRRKSGSGSRFPRSIQSYADSARAYNAKNSCPTRICFCTRTGQVMLDQSDARSLMDEIRDYYEERDSL